MWGGGAGEAGARFLRHLSDRAVNPAGGRINKRGLAVGGGFKMEEESEDSV